jgi:hypothetical protein
LKPCFQFVKNKSWRAADNKVFNGSSWCTITHCCVNMQETYHSHKSFDFITQYKLHECLVWQCGPRFNVIISLYDIMSIKSNICMWLTLLITSHLLLTRDIHIFYFDFQLDIKNYYKASVVKKLLYLLFNEKKIIIWLRFFSNLMIALSENLLVNQTNVIGQSYIKYVS